MIKILLRLGTINTGNVIIFLWLLCGWFGQPCFLYCLVEVQHSCLIPSRFYFTHGDKSKKRTKLRGKLCFVTMLEISRIIRIIIARTHNVAQEKYVKLHSAKQAICCNFSYQLNLQSTHTHTYTNSFSDFWMSFSFSE